MPNPEDDYNEPVIENDLVLNLMVFGDLVPAKNQREDKYLAWVFDILEKNIDYPVSKKKLDPVQIKLFKVLPKLVLKKGRVWYLQQSEGSKDRLFFMVHGCDIAVTITSVHDSETGGHLGIDKTLEK